MGITSNIDFADLNDRFNRLIVEIDAQIVDMLHRIGQEAVAAAKNVPSDIGFKDQTGNLRSSIGYIIFKDGVPLETFFNKVKNGTEGVKTGEKFAEEVGKGHKEGYLLVVVAGMNYAIYVESKGRDVLTTGELTAKKELARHQADMVKNVRDAIKILFKEFGLPTI